MTKKDYAIIAKVISDLPFLSLSKSPLRRIIVADFARALDIYPNFNVDKFVRACMPEASKL